MTSLSDRASRTWRVAARRANAVDPTAQIEESQVLWE
jgi:hypothetical protein